jgi:ribosomal protein L29
MKSKEFKELKNKETKELVKMLVSKRHEIAKTVPSLRVGKEKNLKKNHNLRIEVAKILTILSEKKIMDKEGVTK